jgi:rhomboid family GlyGly-CTERM serine protease
VNGPIIANAPCNPVKSHTSRPGLARRLNLDGRYGPGLLLAVLLLLAPLLGGSSLELLWRYERSGVAQGEWWRLLTAHVMHLDAWHAMLNCMGLALLWALFARSYRLAQWGWALLVTIVTIDLGFWFISTGLQWYVGASAVLHGVFACGCIALIRQRDAVGVVAAAVFVAKLLWEQIHGPLPLETRHPVITVSHAYGALGGALAGLLLRGRSEPL